MGIFRAVLRVPLRGLLAAGALGMGLMIASVSASAQPAAQTSAQAPAPASVPAKGGDKVVYHIDNADAQATKGLRNIRNHLDVAPDTEIIVVTHADGVKFLMEGAKDPNNPNVDYAALVSALKARGVRFEVCEITLRNNHLKREQFTMDADFTPSGVARVARLQAREGYAYIKP